LPQAELHVQLAAADPDIADQYIVQLNGPRADDFHGVRPARRGRLDLGLPTPVCSRGRRRGILSDFHADRVSRFRPSPDPVWLAALEHHVVAKNRTDEWKGGGLLERRANRAFTYQRDSSQHRKRNESSFDLIQSCFHIPAPLPLACADPLAAWAPPGKRPAQTRQN
jgi:hypothetical protein